VPAHSRSVVIRTKDAVRWLLVYNEARFMTVSAITVCETACERAVELQQLRARSRERFAAGCRDHDVVAAR
jgi:hypothetical protein